MLRDLDAEGDDSFISTSSRLGATGTRGPFTPTETPVRRLGRFNATAFGEDDAPTDMAGRATTAPERDDADGAR